VRFYWDAEIDGEQGAIEFGFDSGREWAIDVGSDGDSVVILPNLELKYPRSASGDVEHLGVGWAIHAVSTSEPLGALLGLRLTTVTWLPLPSGGSRGVVLDFGALTARVENCADEVSVAVDRR
jgi:hypothetical protein